MVTTRAEKRASTAQSPLNGKVQNGRIAKDKKTDYTRWRLRDIEGRQTWHYLSSDEQVKEWPQTIADKYHLGLPTDLPDLKPTDTPLDAVKNCLAFYSHLQLEPGNWGCEYGGPMFLLPGVVITWYVTEQTIPQAYATEIVNYLYARQNKDGGWGLHIEGESTVFGTSMNYVVMRILGVGPDEPRMIKARAVLHELGGVTHGPHWTKFWMSVLGVAKWDLVNPTPPELWLLPDWVPFAPWRWWIHMRMVFLPMSYVWSKRWQFPENELVRSLRQEMYTEDYARINFLSHRNSICPRDNYHPKSFVLNSLNWLLVNVWPALRTQSLAKKAEDHVWRLIQYEDENTDYADLAPVNAPMNTLVCYIKEGRDSYSVRRHIERLEEFLWVKDEGMLVNGTNGVQNWDTAFTIQAVVDAGLAEDPKHRNVLLKALEYLESQQVLENRKDADICYRHPTKGSWGFSNKDQSYAVSDCTSEVLKAVLQLQRTPGFPQLVSDDRLKLAVDIILTYQHPGGGCASYEPARGSEKLELLNAAEVFGRIMVEYDYPECTTACVTALRTYQSYYPSYRRDDIDRFIERALGYIRSAQRPDGSWYGSWGICFTYAGMFALESLKTVGESYQNSDRVQRACQFFIDRQMEDGGWGETYRSCETGVYTQHEQSQVVQTAWVIIGLLSANYPDVEPIKKALRMIMGRQQRNGEWLQEAIEGVFNKSCMISYPNYKFIFPMKALGMYAQKYGDIAI